MALLNTFIRKGYGFDVQGNFARARADTPIELAPSEYAKPGCIIGYIAGDPAHQFGFMRSTRVRVHVQKVAIANLPETISEDA